MFRFFTILLIGILSGVEVDLFIPSFPELKRVFNLSPFMVQLTLSINFIAYCVSSLFAGTLADRYNRRTIMLWSLLVFVLGSVCCVFATHFSWLLIGRFLQGLGIAGPTVLGYVILADEYPPEKQAGLLGILGGVVTMGMSFAPVVGSYVNLYFNWRGNFVVLLVLGIACFIASFITVPHRKGDPTVSLSLKAYLPLLRSPKLMTFVLGIGFFVVPYWVFVGMAPLFYMEAMAVPLKEFGYYQGAGAVAFSVTSFLSPKILKWFGEQRCLRVGLCIYGLSTLTLFALGVFNIHDPMIITGVMVFEAIGAVFPINILYPLSLHVLDNTKARAAALTNATRLLFTAIVLEAVSFFYGGTFFPISLAMLLAMCTAYFFIGRLLKRDWHKGLPSHVPGTI